MEKASRIPILYKPVLKDVAKQAIFGRQYDEAIIYLNMLLDNGYIKSTFNEINFLFATASANKAIYEHKPEYWKDADKHFEKSVTNPPNARFYQRYAYLNMKDWVKEIVL